MKHPTISPLDMEESAFQNCLYLLEKYAPMMIRSGGGSLERSNTSLSSAEKEKILSLHALGLGCTAIAKAIPRKLSPSTVKSFLQKHRQPIHDGRHKHEQTHEATAHPHP